MRHGVRGRLDLIEQPLLFHRRDDALARLEAVEAAEFGGRGVVRAAVCVPMPLRGERTTTVCRATSGSSRAPSRER